MRKSTWREYLTGERNFRAKDRISGKEILDTRQKAQILSKIRKRAIQCFEDLTLIFENLHKISNNPDKQFSQIIFSIDYPRFWKNVELAKQFAYDYRAERITPHSLHRLQAKLTLKGIPFDTKRLIMEKNYRLSKVAELMARTD